MLQERSLEKEALSIHNGLANLCLKYGCERVGILCDLIH